MKKNKTILYYSLLALLFSPSYIYAQATSLSTEGTDFWFTFMPNYHAQYDANDYMDGDSLHIYISSLTPNSGTLSYVEGYLSQTNKSITWNIPNAGSIYKVTIPYTAALRGCHNIYPDWWGGDGRLDANEYDNKKVTSKSFHIVADSNCSVYAVDYALTSAEAFIVLPTQVLGTEYFINTYNTHSIRNDGVGTPSQFAIVAPNDNTTINITPTNGTAQSVTLNRGEVYLMQADPKVHHSDMTGSRIVADKEIAVFAGHQRAAIPKELRGNPSRDCLIEQQLPFRTWGKKVALAPFEPPSGNNQFNRQTGLYRVVAAMDNTNIYEDEQLVATINAGEFYEGTLRAVIVSSNNPIMATAFMPTITQGRHGDPSMVAMPPVEQYKLDMNIMNAQIVTRDDGDMFTDQYIMLLVDITRENDIYIDGVLQNPSMFISIGGSGYAYANIKTPDGQHSISAELPVAVVVYGYGYAVSYGYLGGMTFFDMTNTSELDIDSCSGSAVWEHKTVFATIASYEIVDTYNCTLTETDFSSRGITLDVKKINEDDIAYFSVRITDLNGNDTTYQSDTIGFYRMAYNAPDVINFGQQSIGTLGKRSFSITNTGTWPITIDKRNFLLSYNTNFTIGKSGLVTMLQPNDSIVIEVFYAPTSLLNGPDIDTLLFNWLCTPVPYKSLLSGVATEYGVDADGTCDVPVRILVDSLLISHALPSYISTSSNQVSYSFVLPAEGSVAISIYDANGSLVKKNGNFSFKAATQSGSAMVSDTSHTPREDSLQLYELLIDVADLANGLYFIELQIGDGIRYTKLFINR